MNRLLVPMINEAAFIVQEGTATPEAIDDAMKLGAAHPMGPLALADLIGLDVCLAIMEVLQEGFGDPKYRPCPLLKRMEQAGFIARQRDPDDERLVLITLTPHGRALREQAEEVPKELARRIEAAPDEIAHVRSVVQSLVGKLDEAV